jgi:hypothetical protein
VEKKEIRIARGDETLENRGDRGDGRGDSRKHNERSRYRMGTLELTGDGSSVVWD